MENIPAFYQENDVLIFGCGGHGKTVLELVRSENILNPVALVDDSVPAGTIIMGVPVVGGAQILGELYRRGLKKAINAVGGIGNVSTRISVFDMLSAAGFQFPTVVHPTAFIEKSAILADGVQVLPKVYVGTESQLGFGCLINSGVIISHDCRLGRCVNLSPGAMLAGNVDIGDFAQVGMGVTININIHIGKYARIGNGATVKKDVPDDTIVRAGSVWPSRNNQF